MSTLVKTLSGLGGSGRQRSGSADNAREPLLSFDHLAGERSPSPRTTGIGPNVGTYSPSFESDENFQLKQDGDLKHPSAPTADSQLVGYRAGTLASTKYPSQQTDSDFKPHAYQIQSASHPDQALTVITAVAVAPSAGYTSKNLAEVVISSDFARDTPETRYNKVVQKFNAGNPGSFLQATIGITGVRINPGQYRIVHSNYIPQLVPFTDTPMRLHVQLTGVKGDAGIYNGSDLCFGAYGRYVLNVKPGHLGLGWSGTQAVIYSEGTHVVKDAQFKNNDFKQTPINQPVIQHGNILILRIPQGKIATVWNGNTPVFLEASQDPYVFDDPCVSLQRPVSQASAAPDFYNAAEPLISHGVLKRIMPKSGTVIVVYNAGQRQLIKPQDGQENPAPVVLDLPNCEIGETVPTSLTTKSFPSIPENQARRPTDCIKAQTSDGSTVGLVISISFFIKHPETALHNFRSYAHILRHMEEIFTADINKLLRNLSSQQFMGKVSTTVEGSADVKLDLHDHLQLKLTKEMATHGIVLTRFNIESSDMLEQTAQSKEAWETAVKIGNIDNTNKISTATAEQKVTVAKLEADAATTKADGEAAVARIKADAKIYADVQEIKSKAAAEANATSIKAYAEADAIFIKAQAEAKAMTLKGDAERELKKQELEMLADVYKNSAQLMNLRFSELSLQAMTQANVTVVSPDVAQTMFGAGSRFFNPPVFNPMRQVTAQESNGE